MEENKNLEEQVEHNDKKQNTKIWRLVGIVVLLAVISFVFYYLNKDVAQAPVKTAPVDELAVYFANQEKKLTPDVMPPEDYKARLDEQLAKLQQEIITEEALDGGNPYSGYLGVANTYRTMGDYAQAEIEYKKVAEKYPDDFLIWHNLGVMHEDMHQYLDAAHDYTKSIAIKPVETIAYLKLADLYVKFSEHPEKAKEVYLKALTGTNNNINVLKFFAVYLEDILHNNNEAILYWEEVLKQDPDNEAVEDRIAELKNEL